MSARVRVAYVAERLAVRPRTVQEMAAKGQIPGAARIGKLWTFDPIKLERWISDQNDPEKRGKAARDAENWKEFDREMAGEKRRLLADREKATGAYARVYVVGYGPYVKIGTSKSEKGNRISALQTGAPESLTVYAHLAGGRDLEAALHKRFATYRLQGEWFRKIRALAEWIKAGCPVTEIRTPAGTVYKTKADL